MGLSAFLSTQVIDTTSVGRSVMTAVDAAAARTALGLGTLATQSGTFSGTSSGTNTGDQTITLTGDVTGSGTGSFATTIANSAVTNAMLAGSIAISKLAITGTPDGTKFLRDDGTWAAASGGSGLTSLNGLTGSTQTFAVGTSGTDFGISSSGDVHTFNLPDAGASARGVVTTGTQTFAGAKTLTGLPIVTYVNSGTTLGGASGIPSQGLALINSNGGTSGNPFGILFGGTSGYHHSAIFGVQGFDVNNRSGDIVICTRPNSSDSSLTEALRVSYDGTLNVGRTPSGLAGTTRIALNTRNSASLSNLDGAGSVFVVGEGSTSQNAGAGLVLAGPYTGTTWTAAAGIKACKTNGTAGDYGFDLTFHTRVNGGNSTEKMRITTDGALAFLNDTFTQRNSTNAQTFNLSNTWTSSTNFEYGRFQWNTNEFRIGTAVGSAGGTQRNTVIGSWNSAGTFSPFLTISSAGAATFSGAVSSSFAGTALSLSSTSGAIDIASRILIDVNQVSMRSNVVLGWSNSTTGVSTIDVRLVRDAAATLSLVNSTNAQTFRVYNTYTSSTSHEYLKFSWATNVAEIGTVKGSGGGSARDLVIKTDDTERLRFASTGLMTHPDAHDIAFGTTTGTKIGTATTQKIGFWNATPIVQPTTGVASATRTGGGGTALTDTDTYDGYTIAQVVKALRNLGVLA